MARQKPSWIVVESAGTPAGWVAQRTIRARLDAVWRETQAAAGRPADTENVHRLRVATRRTLAACAAFRDLLPAKRRAWFEKRLRQLRRAAGEARDLDVLTGRLAPGATDERPDPGVVARVRLIAMLSRQRDVSRQPIREIYDELVESGWARRVEGLLARIPAGRDQPTFAEYARRRLPPIVGRFFTKADRRLRDDDDVHALRIAGKKLRYVLEIFAPVFPQRVRARCQDALERLQETLGEFTDHAAAADRFERLGRQRSMTANRATLAALRRREAALASEARKAFVKWWNPVRRRELRRTFERSLRRRTA
jgi:CHAD domain-containing protein